MSTMLNSFRNTSHMTGDSPGASRRWPRNAAFMRQQPENPRRLPAKAGVPGGSVELRPHCPEPGPCPGGTSDNSPTFRTLRRIAHALVRKSSARSAMFIVKASGEPPAPLGAACYAEIATARLMSLLAELEKGSVGLCFYKPGAPNGAFADGSNCGTFRRVRSKASGMPPASSVPEGRLRTLLALSRPFGTRRIRALIPTLKRWAILKCPSGTRLGRIGSASKEVNTPKLQ
jgi:hypothetical protein